MHLSEPLQEGWLSLCTLPVRIYCVTLALGKSSCLVVLVVRGQEKPPSEVTWAHVTFLSRLCTSHWTLTALVNSAVYRIAVYYNFNFHMKHFKETMGWNTPGYTQDFETPPKNQESFRIPSMKLYFTFLGKLWPRCPMHAPHALLFPPQALFFSSCSFLCHLSSHQHLLSKDWSVLSLSRSSEGDLWYSSGTVGRKLCHFSSFAFFFTSTVLQDAWHILPRLINLLVVRSGKTYHNCPLKFGIELIMIPKAPPADRPYPR